MAFISNLGLAFSEIVQAHEHRTALLYPASGECVTYRQLGNLVETIAAGLSTQGLGQGDVVAMFHDKSPAAFAAMLACLKLGIIYTNLDADSPWPRIGKIINNCQPRAIVNAFTALPFAAEFNLLPDVQVLNLQNLARPLGSRLLPEAGRSVTGASPAYIMFTSGSTGVPKGAVMSHANLLWFTQWARSRFDITPDDILTNVNPIYFDNSVFDFYTAIFSGAALVPLLPEQVKDTRLLVQLVDQARCTVWFSVPSLLVYLLTTRVLSTSSFPAVRKIIFGGEGFPKPKLKQLYDLFGGRAELENVYGPTECTCICSASTISDADFQDMQNLATLGRLAQNFDGEILPLNLAEKTFGELFLRGPQVGLGYYNDPDRTAKAFVQNPNHSRYADVGYRTGDLVYQDAAGCLHFKGRADFQIKHMGYRIELEEIEAALNTLPEVRECAVIYQSLGNGLGQIIAYAVVDSEAFAQTLLPKVAAIVPHYMVPKRMITIDVLPKNANGKIDRVALQEMATRVQQASAETASKSE